MAHKNKNITDLLHFRKTCNSKKKTPDIHVYSWEQKIEILITRKYNKEKHLRYCYLSFYTHNLSKIRVLKCFFLEWTHKIKNSLHRKTKMNVLICDKVVRARFCTCVIVDVLFVSLLSGLGFNMCLASFISQCCHF